MGFLWSIGWAPTAAARKEAIRATANRRTDAILSLGAGLPAETGDETTMIGEGGHADVSGTVCNRPPL